MSKHTPGPWAAYGQVIRDAYGRFIAKVEHYGLPGVCGGPGGQEEAI